MSKTSLRAAAALALLLASCGPTGSAPSKSAAPKAEEKKPDGPDHGKLTGRIQRLREDLAKDGCNKKLALTLAEKLNEANDHAGAIEWVGAFEEKCGAWPRLLWAKTYAHEQSKQWKEAAATATRLVESEPSDSDFWWWRGRAHAEQELLPQAVADFTQSMALRPNGFAAGRWARIAEQDGRPCDGAFALQAYLEDRTGKPDAYGEEKRTELWLKGGCDALAGKGKAEVKLPGDAPLVTAKGKIAGKPATFLVSERVGLTAVSKRLAAAAGLAAEPGAPSLAVRAGGAFRSGPRVTVPSVELAGARAEKVDVVIVDELPAGVDAVLGASFLHRFAAEREGGKLALRARKQR